MRLPAKTTISLAATIVAAFLVVALTVFLVNNRPPPQEAPARLDGRPLASYSDIYPVRADAAGHLYLDKARFMKAVEMFRASPSAKPISDIVYLGQGNNVMMLLNDAEKESYRSLLGLHGYSNLANNEKMRDRVLQTYIDIVDGIGETFAGTATEIVLHDTRDPLHSVVALQNPISGRRLGDTNTNLGLELIKSYSDASQRPSRLISYSLTLKDGRHIKSSTIPIFDDTYGLIALICLNIDISKLQEPQSEQTALFLENFKRIRSNEKVQELIENSKIPK